ncbi:MAG: glutamate-5-semialdehyde dehydrogenase [Clostridia bacterium]|nr:glutamate-5-semialdehyde dehydrogenase [Clostridia bacterium]
MTTLQLMQAAKAAAPTLATLGAERKNAVLLSLADALLAAEGEILAANAADLAAAEGTVAPVMLDRLRLDAARIAGMADGIRAVAALPDPVGRKLATHTRADGLLIERVSVPMGVIAIIYESRPNVTSDAAALAVKAGSACILRGGREAHRSSVAIVTALRRALAAADRPEALVSVVEDTSRASAVELMEGVGYIDLLIPRGSAGLIRTCVEKAKVPVVETGTGICHIYVDGDADLEMALDIVENAKTSRPSVCNAAEVCLVDRRIAAALLPRLAARLGEQRRAVGKPPVELRLDGEAAALIPGTPAGDADFDTEFLDYILAVRVVGGVEEAISHIAAHSTGHSEAIVTANTATADRFLSAVDSAAVYHNASTRFTDGGEFGLGCEMGISTQKLHARGPMGLSELTSYKYVIRGTGHTR